MRTRTNVHELPPGDQTLHWYAVGVAAMKNRPVTDPLSWEYQAMIHAAPVDPIPAAMIPFWDQCQHSTSFFLPWHRMYLLRFERIIAAEIAANGGPADWALPYWNYSKPTQDLLPPAFRNPATTGGGTNSLYVSQRNPAANAGIPFFGPADIAVRNCLRSPGTTTFGGFFGDLPSSHFGTLPGTLEQGPHNTVHGAIGRGGGFMGNAYYAALDPIFWLHHANIDRLWEVWLARDLSHRNLSSPYWQNGVTFQFNTEAGTVMTMRTADVLNLLDPAVDYQYDDISDPLAGGGSGPLTAGGAAPSPLGLMKPETQMELAGATLAPVQLDSQVSHVALPTPVTQEAFLAAAAESGIGPAGAGPAELQQVALVLENVTSADNTPTYDVYLSVPDEDKPDEREDRFVGRAALFGIAQASDPNGQHGGSGQTVAFDVTEIYQELAKAQGLNQEELKVSFVPVEPEADPHVSVGRVSLYFK